MTRIASLSLFALAGLACSSGTPHVYELGSSFPPPPDTLVALATEVRAAGGLVLVGSIDSTVPGVPEQVTDVPEPGLGLAYPTVVAEVTVMDPLGDTMPPTLSVQSGDGLPEVVRADGTVHPGWVVSGGSADREHRWLPPSGTRVLFVVPAGEGYRLVWVTDVAAGVASGAGTVASTDVPLTSLSR